MVALEVLAVDRRRDAPDALAVLVGGEERPFAVREERVLLRVEAILEVLIERANVRGVAVVDAIDHTEEVAERGS